MILKDLDIAVVGGGAFGTTLASLLTEAGRATALWMREADIVEEVNSRHTNERFLSGFSLPARLTATTDLGGTVARSAVVLLVVPSRFFRGVARQAGEALEGDQVLVHATKGIEVESGKRMSQVLREETCALKIGVLSGPNLAREIMAGHPAGMLVASRYDEVVAAVQGLFAGSRIRTYAGRDVVGAEVGGSFKNIIALAAGAVDGMGFGDNSKAMLLTRGLTEMVRYGVALGADPLTFGGLAGIGDLMATCFSPLSRNYQVGNRLAKGEAVGAIEGSMVHVAEGVPTAAAVFRQMRALGLDLHIVRAVHGVLYEGWTVKAALEFLMGNPVGQELAAMRFA